MLIASWIAFAVRPDPPVPVDGPIRRLRLSAGVRGSCGRVTRDSHLAREPLFDPACAYVAGWSQPPDGEPTPLMKVPFSLVLAATLAACGGSPAAVTDPTESPAPTSAPTAEPTSTAETTPRATRTARPATPRPATGEVTLDIAVWDDTAANPPPADAEIWVRGEGSWFPDLSFGGDSRALGEYSVGEPGEFYIYPDGRGGSELRVEFVMTPDMVPISGSAQAQTTVEIHDSEVVVIGMAIPDIEATFTR